MGLVLIAQNAPADDLFFLVEGRVEVAVRVGNGPSHRVSTGESGTIFGELALFGRAPRTADVIATTDGEALVLDRAGIEALATEAPTTWSALLLAVGSSLSERLRRANGEIRALSR